MNIEIKMPDLATTADEIRIVRWLVGVGDPVRLGQPLLEIETGIERWAAQTVTA